MWDNGAMPLVEKTMREALLHEDGDMLRTQIEELSIQNRQLRRFIEVGKVLYDERNVDRLLPFMMTEISKALDADRGTLFLVNWERMQLWTKFAEGMGEKSIQLDLKMGLVGLSVLRRQLINVPHAYEDPRFNAAIDKRTGFRTDSVLCVPFFDRQGQVMGALQMLNRQTGVFKRSDEQKALKTASKLTSMNGTGRLALSKAEELICELRRAIRCDRGTLFLVDKKRGELFSVVAEELDDVDIRLDLNLGIAGLVAVTGKALNIEDVYDDPRFDRGIDEMTGYCTKSILCVPIKSQSGEVLGVIEAINNRRGKFTEADIELLKALSSYIGIFIENAMLFDEQHRQFKSVLEVLAASIDAKDPLTAGHSQKVTEYSVGIARELGFEEDEVDTLSVAALLHDYGKLGVDDKLLKHDGELTPEEYECVKQHVLHTRNILSKMQFTRKYRDVPLIASCHHERLDGSGYMHGLKGHEIPFMAKIIAVADVFEALTAKRFYHEALRPKDALAFLDRGVGTKFDGNVVAALKRYLKRNGKGLDRPPKINAPHSVIQPEATPVT